MCENENNSETRASVFPKKTLDKNKTKKYIICIVLVLEDLKEFLGKPPVDTG